jgi:outer membrane protein assembly factor BamB
MPKSSPSASSRSTDASHRLTSSRCPECGAPVDFRSVPRDQLQVKCAYCGTLITIPGRTQVYATPPHAASSHSSGQTATVVVTSDSSVVKGGWGCGVVSLIVIVLSLVVGGIGLFSASFVVPFTRVVTDVTNGDSTGPLSLPESFSLPTMQQALAPAPRLVSAPLVLGAHDTSSVQSPVQMVVFAYRENGSLLIGFDSVERVERWRSDIFSDRTYEMGMTSDAARIYVADGAQLVALDRQTGEIAWQSSLANNLQTGCAESAPCLQLADEQVIALARDGTVQAFAGSTGAPLWSRRLNGTPRQIIVNSNQNGNDQVILIDVDDSNRAVVLVLNGTNGDLAYELQPTCAISLHEMRPSANDQYVVTPDGGALLVVGSGTYACIWRYNLADGSLVWGYTPADVNGPLPFTWSMSSLALADPMLYFIKEEGHLNRIYAVDTQSQGSAPAPLYAAEEYDLTVLYPLGELLLVSAQPSYAPDEVELWAINRVTGERRWQRKLETSHSFDEWVTRPTDQGIFLSVCFWENDECDFEVLDLATGTSQGQVRQATTGSYSGAAWLGDQGYLTIDGKLYVLNLSSATVEYTWP